MEGRCSVETLVDFGFSAAALTARVQSRCGADVFICTGSDEVYVYNPHDGRHTAVLQFPSPVSDLDVSQDKQLLYVACRDGVYRVSLSFSRSSSGTDAPSSLLHLQISGDSLIVREEGVSAVLLMDATLLSLSQTDTSWLLTMRRVSGQSEPGLETLTSFRLPLVSDTTHQSGKRGLKPLLICVRPGEEAAPPPSSTSSSDRCLHLEPTLFKLLFGIDAALIKSPVVLFGLPDGRLGFLPLHLPGPRLRVLHSLEQPVVFVGASVVMETAPGYPQCLVVVGEQGRVVVILTEEGGSEGGGLGAVFSEGYVAGPVLCAHVNGRRLYYSTGSDLLALDLSEGSHGGTERGDEPASKAAFRLQPPRSLNVCRLVALAEMTWNTAADQAELLALSCRGQLQRITLPGGEEDAGSSRLAFTQAGSRIKDLLSAIGDVFERASALKNTIKSKNEVLKHLNHVMNITFLLMTDGKEQKPIRCSAVTSWSRVLQRDSMSLTCFLENGTSFILERGWTLNVSVCALCDSDRGEGRTTNFSFPLSNLHPGEKLETSVPLATAGDACFPITVSCSLIFSLSSLIGEEAVAALPGLQSGCIGLPLNSLTVDWLHAVQVNDPPQAHKNAPSHSCDTATADVIQDFLTSHRSRCRGAASAAPTPKKQRYSASVKVSADLLRETLAPSSLCVSLLDWLFAESPGCVKRGNQEDKVPFTCPVVYTRGPDGHVIKLSTKEVKVSEETGEEEDESLDAVEVQVESSSMAAVCGLHHAVLLRVQTLLQKTPERVTFRKSVRSLCLRKVHQRAEQMLKRIHQSRLSGGFDAGMSAGPAAQSLLSMYQELRENPLVII